MTQGSATRLRKGKKPNYTFLRQKISTATIPTAVVLAALVLTVITTGFFSTLNLHQVDQDFSDFQALTNKSVLLNEIQGDLAFSRLYGAEFVRRGREGDAAQVRFHVESALTKLTAASQLASEEEVRSAIASIQANLEAYLSAFERVASLQSRRDILINQRLNILGPSLSEKLRRIRDTATWSRAYETALAFGELNRLLMVARVYLNRFTFSSSSNDFDRLRKSLDLFQMRLAAEVQGLEEQGARVLGEEALDETDVYRKEIAQLEQLVGERTQIVQDTLEPVGSKIDRDILHSLDLARKEQQAIGTKAATSLAYAISFNVAMSVLLILIAIYGALKHSALQSEFTQRRHAEEALQESEGRLRDLAESASDWFWEMDADLRFSYFSDRLYEVTGIDPSSLIGKTRGDLMSAEELARNKDKWVEHLRQLEERLPFRNFSYTLTNTKGEKFHVVLSGKPVFDSQGQFQGYRGAASDVTAQVEAQEVLERTNEELEKRVSQRTAELQHELTEHERTEIALRAAREDAVLANHAKSLFLANMSHELRTPLNAIIGFAEIMDKSMLGPMPETYRGYASDIHNSGKHLLALISDILDMSKIEAGALALNEQATNVCTICREAVALLQEKARENQVTIDFAQGEDVWLKADPVRMKQIALNLLSNAIKFSPEGNVSIEAKSEEKSVILVFADTGCGLTPEEISEAFKPFRQSEKSAYASRAEGTGLGLPLTKKLVELHNGTITIDSQPGQGTRVTVHFPAERALSSPPEQEKASGPGNR